MIPKGLHCKNCQNLKREHFFYWCCEFDVKLDDTFNHVSRCDICIKKYGMEKEADLTETDKKIIKKIGRFGISQGRVGPVLKPHIDALSKKGIIKKKKIGETGPITYADRRMKYLTLSAKGLKILESLNETKN